jgi:hypothetical protein
VTNLNFSLGRCVEHIEVIVNKIVFLINGLSKIESFGKKTPEAVAR